MRTISSIVISFCTLILLVFGASGVGVMKCSCSGKTSLVIPMEQGCCSGESGCMTFTVSDFSVGEMQRDADMQPFQPMLTRSFALLSQQVPFLSNVVVPVLSSGYTPPGSTSITVLRV